MAAGDYKGISDTAEAKSYLLEILENAQGYVAWDTETTALYPRDGYVLGVSLTYKTHQGRYIMTDCLDEECIELLRKIARTYYTVFHNMKFDFKMIKYHLDIDFDRSRVHDTMVMHYVLDETDSHGLKQLALKYTDYGDYDSELDDFKKEYCAANGILQDDFTYDLIPFDVISKYASIDTAVTFDLFHKFWPIVQKNDKLRKVYEEILSPGT
jgi:DNA polymerase I-like protein with 3'-5' exonuclease and polymerase domains